MSVGEGAVKKFLMTVVAVAGAALIAWAAYAYLGSSRSTFRGFHPMYPALVGLALLSGGLIGRQD